MGEMAEALIEGDQCSHCGQFFEESHGYPVLCQACYRSASKAERDVLQQAIHKEL